VGDLSLKLRLSRPEIVSYIDKGHADVV